MSRFRTRTTRTALVVVALAGAVLAGLISSASLRGSSAAPRPDSWQPLPPAPLAFEAGHASVWTGTELIVSGLTGTPPASTEAAIAYDPAKRRWRRLAAPPATGNYCRRSAVWTGEEMLVWACRLTAYDPRQDTWRLLPRPPAPGAGIVVWTGRELLGWGGGCCGDALAGGEAYDPDTGKWRRLADSPLAPEQQPLGAWTGHELVLFVSGISALDGKPFQDELARAAAYDPRSDTWRRIAPLPEARRGATAVWDGREVLVVGGRDGHGSPTGLGFAYNPSTNGWRRLPVMESGRIAAVTAWTGSRLLVWGGDLGRDALAVARSGFAFDPQTDRWSRLPRSPLRGRLAPAAVWTGRELLVWGGLGVGTGRDPEHLADGAALTPGDGSAS
jgi:hypothetical protein